MKEITGIYQQMGISPAVYAYGEAAIARLKDRFDAIDQVAEYNQAKVLAAFRKNRVSAGCFAASTGYGYNDEGRDKLEQDNAYTRRVTLGGCCFFGIEWLYLCK